jgi:hypothetical protein
MKLEVLKTELLAHANSTDRGYNFSDENRLIRVSKQERRRPMFVVAVVICLLVFAVIAGADLLVSNLNSDELSNMGVEKRS